VQYLDFINLDNTS